MEFSAMTQKWPSRPKEHKAARIRDNQRRHRARTKAYIADLENQLAEVQTRLSEALKQNAALTSELRSLRDSYDGGSARNGHDNIIGIREPSPLANRPPTPLSLPSNDDEGSAASDYPSAQSLVSGVTNSTELQPQASAPTALIWKQSEGNHPSAQTKTWERKPFHGSPSSDPPRIDLYPAPVRPATLAGASAAQADRDSGLAVLRSDCSHLPPPALGESTILCRDAYGIIQQQNHSGMDLHAVGKFLTPGFRRATLPSDGCRVESHRVFLVIDALSSSVPSALWEGVLSPRAA